MEETVFERITCIYDSNDVRILKDWDKVMNIDNITESWIIVAFDNERNHVLMRVDHAENNIVSMSKVRYVHPNNPTIIKILPCS